MKPERRDRLGPPPVEPMSDLAWARVERNVFGRLDRAEVTSTRVYTPAPKRGWAVIVLPIAAAAAVIGYVELRHPAGQPVASAGSDAEPARFVAGASPSEVTVGDAHVTLEAQTAVVMDPQADKPSALVEYGAAWFEVAPRGKRPPFVVHAGDATVRVIGTKFKVSHSGEHAEVEVDHGIVEVRFHGKQTVLHAHEHWSSDETPAAGSDDLIDPVDLDAIAIDPVPAKPHHARKHVAAPAPKVPSAPATDDGRARYEALAKLEATNAAAAMKGYLELSRGSGPWAEVALYAGARLAADRQDTRAVTLLTIYLRRFPSGANADDARELLTRLQGE